MAMNIANQSAKDALFYAECANNQLFAISTSKKIILRQCHVYNFFPLPPSDQKKHVQRENMIIWRKDGTLFQLHLVA